MEFSKNLNKIFTPFLLGKYFDIDIYIHWSWWMMFIFMLVVSPSTAAIFIGLFSIIVLHEFGHCFAAKYYRYQVDSIMLYMIGGVANIRGIHSLKAEGFIVLCGPLVNVLLIPVFYLLSSSNYYLQRLEFINMSLLIFNMLPILPLDGGQLLRTVLSAKLGYVKGIRWTTMISNVAAIFLGLFGLITNHLVLVVMAMFLYYVSQQEAQSLEQLQSQESILETERTIAKLHAKLEEIRENR
jgi:Zn-dependent protease